MAAPTETFDNFNCVVVTPDKVLFEGRVNRLLVPSRFGQLAVLPMHTPIYSVLIKGQVIIDDRRGQREIDIEGGLIRARSNNVTIIVGI